MDRLEPKPFSFVVDGKRVDVEGAVDDGVEIRIPRSAWTSKVQCRLADRARFVEIDERRLQYIRKLEDDKAALEQRVAELVAIVEAAKVHRVAEAARKAQEHNQRALGRGPKSAPPPA